MATHKSTEALPRLQLEPDAECAQGLLNRILVPVLDLLKTGAARLRTTLVPLHPSAWERGAPGRAHWRRRRASPYRGRKTQADPEPLPIPPAAPRLVALGAR